MLDLDLISTVEDPNLRLGNIDTSDPTMARERKLRQSNLRGEIFLLSNDNGTVEDYCIVQFLTFVIMTANRNTGPLGSLMANEVRGGSGNELAVGDPRSLQLHLIDLRITIGGRGRGVNEVTYNLVNCTFKVWTTDATCLTVTCVTSTMMQRTMHYHDLKFQCVEDQVRMCNMAIAALAHKRQLPKMIRQKDEDYIPLSLWVGAWNMGGQPPPNILDPWVQRDGYDIVVAGVQGCQEDDWADYIAKNLSNNYVALCEQSIGAIRICLFVLEKHVHGVTFVEYGNEATGFLHVMADKGAVALSMVIYGTRLCFCNVHLSAHDSMAARRVSDVREISSGSGLELGYHASDVSFVSRFNTFFLGDLNFRLEGKREEILDLIKAEEWETLWEMDQLKNEMAKGLLRGSGLLNIITGDGGGGGGVEWPPWPEQFPRRSHCICVQLTVSHQSILYAALS
jgi:hypothetical protein